MADRETAITAEAASNIAFVKYWGARDLERAIPENRSISMTLTRCRSICSARFEPGVASADEVLLAEDGAVAPAPAAFRARVVKHLDFLRATSGRFGRIRIATRNTFPAAAGIASSASGFAALTVAVTRCLGLSPDPSQLSGLARRSGSGSASRSVLGGFVEWPKGYTEEDCYATELAPAEAWDLRDVVVVVERGPKAVSSLDGHRLAATSPHYRARQALLGPRLAAVRRAIVDRDLEALGPVLEEEAIELHLIAMSSRPPVFYWRPATLTVLGAVRALRGDGVAAYATMDAGANVHVICEPACEPAVIERLGALPDVLEVIPDRVGGPPVWRPGTEL